jgi:ferritin
MLNYRIQQEEMSSRIYKGMATWLDFNGYFGAAKLWNSYASEEVSHAGWASEFLMSLNIQPEVPALGEPDQDFMSFPQVIAMSYQHELDIYNQCNELARVSMDEGNFLTLQLAQKFLNEQLDELGKTQNWIDRLEAFGTSEEALRLLDNEMGK